MRRGDHVGAAAAPLVDEEKVRIVEETYLPGNSVSLVARHHGIAANQLFTWRRLMAQGALTAAGAGEEVVPASELRAAHHQIRELQRLLGKKTLENEILREAVGRVTAKAALARDLVAGGRPVSAVAAALGVSRPHLSSRQRTALRRRGRPPLPDAARFSASLARCFEQRELAVEPGCAPSPRAWRDKAR